MTKQLENLGKLFIIFLILLVFTKSCNAQKMSPQNVANFNRFLDSASRYVDLKHCAMTCAPDSVAFYRTGIDYYYNQMRYYYALINGEASAKRLETDTTKGTIHFDKCHCQP